MPVRLDFKTNGALIFDLDGTLWDTRKICAQGWNEVAANLGFGHEPVSSLDLSRVVGKPHDSCIREIFSNLGPDAIEELIPRTMLKDIEMVKAHGGTLYDGVASGLKELKKRHRLFIVSNCQAGYIEAFIEQTQFRHLFEDFECWGNTGRSKAENISDIILRNGLKDALYIGDTEGDFIAAEIAGIPFIQTIYGFGAPVDGQTQVTSFKDLVNLFSY